MLMLKFGGRDGGGGGSGGGGVDPCEIMDLVVSPGSFSLSVSSFSSSSSSSLLLLLLLWCSSIS